MVYGGLRIHVQWTHRGLLLRPIGRATPAAYRVGTVFVLTSSVFLIFPEGAMFIRCLWKVAMDPARRSPLPGKMMT